MVTGVCCFNPGGETRIKARAAAMTHELIPQGQVHLCPFHFVCGHFMCPHASKGDMRGRSKSWATLHTMDQWCTTMDQWCTRRISVAQHLEDASAWVRPISFLQSVMLSIWRMHPPGCGP
eukprot:1143545-Pelagomonas_calceolata.AAC.4